MKQFWSPKPAPRRLGQALLVSIFSSLLLTACGGGSDPVTEITAGTDALTVNAGASASVLSNDRLGGVAATAGTAGNVVFTLTSVALPAGVTVVDGVVAVAATAVPGVVSLSYSICEKTAPTNCASSTAQVTIPAPAIVAVNDTFNLALNASGDVLANDTLGGTPATAARVVVTATSTLPTGIGLSAAGLVTAGSTAVPGSYSVAYRICQTVAPSNCATATAAVTVPALGMVTGRVVDGATALGIAGVTVTAGTATATSDATGAFSLQGVANNTRQSVTFTSSSYSTSAVVANVQAGSNTDLQVRLVRIATSSAVPVAAGGTVTLAGSPAQVVLGANAVQRADGSVPSGNITVRMTPINPAVDTSQMPGDFLTQVAGAPTLIESFGALNVELSDSAGAALNLRAGQSATIRIPLATRSTSTPTSIPLFWFNTVTGFWVQEGTATLAGSGANQYYEGTVTHFTTWNADRVMDTVVVTGCVADVNGVRQSGASVYSDGVDYSGTSRAVTDAAGNFSIQLRRSSVATLTALSGATLSNTLRLDTGAANNTVTACLALGQVGSGVTMKLTWGALPRDLDSHLYAPDGSHVYYSSKGSLIAAPFASLDVDDTSSYGPEVVTITKLMVGTYKYAVNNYSGQSSGLFSNASARVELSIPGRAVELYVPPATGETTSTNWWQLFEFDVDAACNITMRRTGVFSTSSPAGAASSTPVYCSRP